MTNSEVAKPQIFDRTAEKVGEFIRACKIYIRMKMRGTTIEEQV